MLTEGRVRAIAAQVASAIMSKIKPSVSEEQIRSDVEAVVRQMKENGELTGSDLTDEQIVAVQENAEAALSAKSAAESARDQANQSATNAANSAGTASTAAANASSAKTAAQTAQGKAETAQAAAESAKSTASQKATEATNAAQTATSKATAASQSATAAGTAQSKAETAQAAAEAAKAEVERKLAAGDYKGDPGKSAYAYAVDGGYEGTEEDFARQMAVEIVYNDSLNLFDINDPEIVHGYYLSGDGYQGADAGCVITGYIPVEPNTKYTRSAGATIFHSFEYTEGKTKIGRVSATKTFTTSANAAYVRATVIITQTPLETYMFVKGDTLPSVYIPYGNSLIIAGHNIPLGEEVEESDSATITKWGVIGDSLSNQEKWQTTACGILRLTGYQKNAITGAYVADYGDSGDASANAFVNRYLNTPADCDLITIMGGTNDATYKCGDGIGELGTLNTNTFIGAYCTIIEGLLERNPAVRIMLFTPPRCYTAQGVLNPHLAAYVEAVKSIAERYDLPCLDLYNNLGINDKTFDTLLPDYVHFSDALGYRVGRVIGNFVKNNY